MTALQPGVLAPVPAVARYLTFSLQPRANPRRSLAALAAAADGDGCVVGIGDSVLRALNRPLAGLVFVAFGRSLDAFEAQLRRMVGAEDGITDALFNFTRPVTGACFWCPPVKRGRLDLSRIL